MQSRKQLWTVIYTTTMISQLLLRFDHECQAIMHSFHFKHNRSHRRPERHSCITEVTDDPKDIQA